jgi:hypothetical protein
MKLLELVILFYLFIVILNELRVKCVIEGFVSLRKNFKGPMGMVGVDHYYYFNVRRIE